MMKKKGVPGIGEFVICKIKNISQNSALVALEEYDMEGMIHISEIKSGWIKDIRKHIKIGQLVVAKVTKIGGGSYLYLSIKRVDDNQKRNKLKDYNMGIKAEKMFEICAKELGVSIEKAYKDVGDALLEKYGSFYDVFKTAMKTPAKLDFLPKEWLDKIKEIAEKNIEQKEFVFRAMMMIKSLKPDGIETIKNMLKKAEKSGLEVKYISAPQYLVKLRTKDAKKGEKEFREKLDRLTNEKGLSVEYKITE